MAREAELNDFAIRCFRDTADHDYIAARLAFRARLYPQFLWSALQSLEKYLKGILLLNRVKATNLGHDLGRARKLIDTQCPFRLRLRPETEQFIEYLDTYGRFRYLETSWHVSGLELQLLDLAVWEVRRYCRVLDYEAKDSGGTRKRMLDVHLREIEAAEKLPFQNFRLMGSVLTKILDDRKHPARAGLVWKNLWFGGSARKRVRIRRHFQAENAPLSLRPLMLDEIEKYVFLPKEVKDAYRQHAKGQKP